MQKKTLDNKKTERLNVIKEKMNELWIQTNNNDNENNGKFTYVQ